MQKIVLICGAMLLASACSTPQPKTDPQPQANAGALVPCKGEVTGSLIPKRTVCAHGQSSTSAADSWQSDESLMGPGARGPTSTMGSMGR